MTNRKVAPSTIRVMGSDKKLLKMKTLEEAVTPQIVIVINGGYVVCNKGKLVTSKGNGENHILELEIPISDMTVFDKEIWE